MLSRTPHRYAGRLGALAAFALLALGGQAFAQAPDDKDRLPDVEDKVKGYDLTDGYYRVYQKKQHLLAEIPRQRIGKPFLLATSVAGGVSSTGFQWTDMLVQWERLDDHLLLIEKNVQHRSQKGNPITEVVDRTYSDRVVKAMRIIAESRQGSPKRGLLIDFSDLFAGNAQLFFGPVGAALNASVVKVDKLKAFPENLELALTMPQRSDGRLTTIAYSLVGLPDAGYSPREADPRVGYFLTAVKDFTKSGTDTRFVRYVNRWRLEKRDPSLELSPPKQPIVFHLERTVPIRYRRWVKEGILEWNKAFRKVGFYDAIVVEDHELFPDRDAEDARYSFFRWIASDRGFAMGPSRANPLTGEIFDADIIFDDAMVRSYLRQYELLLKETPGTFFEPRDFERFQKDAFWHPFYGTRLAPTADELALGKDAFCQGHPADHLRGMCTMGNGFGHQLFRLELAHLARTDPKAAEPFPEEFIGRMVKEVVMHEVGHTLGLRHNFVASTWKPLDGMWKADPDEATVGSVMDYNPVMVAPLGQEQTSYVTGTLGPYDYWAIEYGYKPVKDAAELGKIASRIAEAGLDYATDEDTTTGDPYVMRWDMGEDPLAYARHRLDLVEGLLPKIKDRVVKDGDTYQRLRQAVDSLLYDAHFAGQLAARFVGGERYNRDKKGDPNGRAPVVVVPAAKQREAVALACDRVLSSKLFELDPELVSHLGTERWWHWGERPGDAAYPYHDRVYAIQRSVLAGLLASERLDRLYEHQLKVGKDEEAYTLGEHFGTLRQAVFGELAGEPKESYSAKAPFVSPPRQSLQRFWVEAHVRLAAKGAELGPAITRALARRELQQVRASLAELLEGPIASRLDVESAAHLDEILRRIDQALDAKFVQ